MESTSAGDAKRQRINISMKKKTLEQGLALFARAFPAKEIDIELCWIMLKDIPDEAFLRSVKRIMASHEEIYQSTNLVALIRKNAKEDTIPMVGDAWAEVLREIGRTGSRGTPEFSHPAIARAVAGVGWRNLCLSELISVERAHFYRIYDQVKERTEREEIAPERLIGNEHVQKLIDRTTQSMGDQ